MVMIRANGKPKKIAEKVLKGKAVKLLGSVKMDKKKLEGPYLQH
jgi:translation elongation factor EF-Ts